jgi:hypothetical protein
MEPPHAGVGRISGVKLTRSNLSVEGHGICYADCPIWQDKAYFEVTVLKPGRVCAGVAWAPALGDARTHLIDAESWVLDVEDAQEGDIIGVQLDQGDFPPTLTLTHNGEPAGSDVGEGMKGELWAVMRVWDGSHAGFFFQHKKCKYAEEKAEKGYGPCLRKPLPSRVPAAE